METKKPVEHGEPPAPTRVETQPIIPRVLRTEVIFDLNISRGEASRRYGLWRLEFLEDVYVRGTNIQKGDFCKVPGNWATMIVRDGRACFADSKLDEETRIMREAQRLGIVKEHQPWTSATCRRHAEFAGR